MPPEPQTRQEVRCPYYVATPWHPTRQASLCFFVFCIFVVSSSEDTTDFTVDWSEDNKYVHRGSSVTLLITNCFPHSIWWTQESVVQDCTQSTMSLSCQISQRCVSLHLGRIAPKLSLSTTASLQSQSLASKSWNSGESHLSVKHLEGNCTELRSRPFSVMASATSTATKTILVTGAGGKTGENFGESQLGGWNHFFGLDSV